MIRVSRKFIEAIKLADRPSYKIAWEAKIHPVLLSKIINSYEKLRQNDSRVIAVGKVLGLSPEECFELEADDE